MEPNLAELTSREQRRIGQELHDTAAQLSGTAMMAETLRQKLGEQASPLAENAARLVQHINDIHRQLRNLAHGLIPVDVEADGLKDALGRLAERSAELYNVDCRCECHEPVLLADNATATHLYRITQEAVQNAVRHGRAKRVVIQLQETPETIVLRIDDDGIGMGEAGEAREGMGLRIMRYRAGLIGAQLQFQSRPSAGTTVQCTIPRNSSQE